jgi:hypothetical protein
MTTRIVMAPGVFWTVESNGVLVLPGKSRERLLTHLEAAAWALISRGDSTAQAITKLAFIGRIEPGAAESALEVWLREWQAAGWIAGEEADG